MVEWNASGAADVGELLGLAANGEGDWEGETNREGESVVAPAGGESSRERLAMPSVLVAVRDLLASISFHRTFRSSSNIADALDIWCSHES